MGSGDIVVGKDPPAPKSASVSPQDSAKQIRDPISDREAHCGAMTQQLANNGALSTPQKFLHLVGYRNPKLRPSGGR